MRIYKAINNSVTKRDITVLGTEWDDIYCNVIHGKVSISFQWRKLKTIYLNSPNHCRFNNIEICNYNSLAMYLHV